MDIVNIEALIAQKRVVTSSDLDPDNDYVIIGKFQTGNAKFRGSNANAYKSYAVPLSEFMSTGTPITLNVIPKGTGPSIADGTWSFSGNDILPLTTGSAIGSASKRVGTVYLSSVIDYAGDIRWISTSLRATLTNTGNLGLDVSPTARLHVQGVDATAGNFAVKVQNSATTILRSISNNGAHITNSTFDGIGTGIANYKYETSTGGNLFTFKSVNGSQIVFDEAGVTKGAIQNTGGFCQISSQFRFTIKDYLNQSHLWMDSSDGHIGIGSAYYAATAALHVAGQDATNANYALKVEDNVGGRILHARNDGKIYIGQENCYISSSALLSPGELNLYAETLLVLDGNGPNIVPIEGNNKIIRFNTWHGGAANNIVEFAGRGAAGFESFVRTYDVDLAEDGFKTYIGSSAASGDTNFRHCFVNGNVHIGYDEALNSGTTKLTIRSRNTLNSQYNIVCQNSALASLLRVRNDGVVLMENLPVAAAGLPSGALWNNGGVINIV